MISEIDHLIGNLFDLARPVQALQAIRYQKGNYWNRRQRILTVKSAADNKSRPKLNPLEVLASRRSPEPGNIVSHNPVPITGIVKSKDVDTRPGGLGFACHFYKRDPTKYNHHSNKKYQNCPIANIPPNQLRRIKYVIQSINLMAQKG